jgi:acetoacetyl-CoA synthetase
VSDLLWQPSEERKAGTNLAGFMREAEAEHGLSLPDYDAVHRWSVDRPNVSMIYWIIEAWSMV